MAEVKTLKDYVTPTVAKPPGIIARPTIDANHFDIKPSLLSMVQQDHFMSSIFDDPNLHLSIFLEYCDTLKLMKGRKTQ
jgi:hypothetical protein